MSNQSIIVVDDDVGFGSLVTRVVAGMGHDVEHIADPKDLMGRYDEVAPDVIFLDIFMPGMDGMEVANWLAAKHFDGKLVFMTGHDHTFLTAARAAMFGRDADVVTMKKPARVAQIREVLNERRGKS